MPSTQASLSVRTSALGKCYITSGSALSAAKAVKSSSRQAGGANEGS
jgi:hypothetical protein